MHHSPALYNLNPKLEPTLYTRLFAFISLSFNTVLHENSNHPASPVKLLG